MRVAADVHYGSAQVGTACVAFEDWADAEPAREWVVRSPRPAQRYEPGQFYRRELPYLLEALEPCRRGGALSAVIVDAHVWLGGGRPGLGARLYEALGGQVAVVGVAKSRFRQGVACEVIRGASRRPLFVSAVGMDLQIAVEGVRAMHGPFRLPTLLRRADALARQAARAAPGP